MNKRVIELDAGDSALIGGACITLVEKSGRRARIVIQAPEYVPIVHPINKPQTMCATGSGSVHKKEAQ